jgi:hypothetical protein
MCRDRGEIYKKNRGFGAKFTGYNESGIAFQWKNPWTESMGPWTGWRSRVCGGPAGSVDHGRGGSRCDQRWGSGGSPVGVGDEEGDEVKLRVCSPVHGQ